MFYFNNLPAALISLMSNFSASAYRTAPYHLYVIAELEEEALKSFPSLHFLLTVTKPADMCELLLASHHHPEISSTCYLHLSPDHYLIWQSPFLLTTFLKVNIFWSAMGLPTGVCTRLGSWWEISRGTFIKSDVGVHFMFMKGKKNEFACFRRNLLLLPFHSGKIWFTFTLCVSF